MTIDEAVVIAKTFVTKVFGDDGISDIALEEIEHDEADRTWMITIGFSRNLSPVSNALAELTGSTRRGRAYRIVKIRETDGEVVSVKIREMLD